MSRARNARRKAKRREAQAATELAQRQSLEDSQRSVILVPVLAIAAILVAIAIAGFASGNGSNQKEIDQEVTTLLAGIPQHGTTLGSREAPTTLYMFADLECPTVKRFVEVYLPSIINKWVRTGALRLEYRPLKTDTVSEHTFFRQEEGTLAAGRQNKLWNFALTFVRKQGQRETKYATESFFSHIASQVSDLNMKKWSRDRNDPKLFKPIALSVHSAHEQGFRFTPSFVIPSPAETSSVQDEIELALRGDIDVLHAEALEDLPALRIR